MAEAGRTDPELDEDIVGRICKYLEEGMLQKDAAILSGIDESTFYRWIRKSASFASRVQTALATYRNKLIQCINLNAVRDGKLALDVLGRRFPEDWAAKVKVGELDPEAEIQRIKKLIQNGDVEDERVPENSEGLLPESTGEAVRPNDGTE